MKTFLAITSALALLLGSPSAAAVTLIIDSNGELTGATGVDVGGTLYDVSFVDGTCASLFSGCDSVTDFTFQTGLAADLAVSALLAQVLTGAFDTDYTLTLGCSTNNSALCLIIVPYDLRAGLFDARVAFNDNNVVDPGNGGISQSPTTFDTAGNPAWVFARFTPAAAVPEPATWATMLFGFGVIGFAMRRMRKQLLQTS